MTTGIKMKLAAYLASSKYIDWRHPAVLSLAKRLAEGIRSDESIARACFEFVRDEISHSLDHKRNPVTCSASQVLEHRTGYCYAKSHLLAALLRANGLPAGLCYQRLTVADGKPPFCLHGLNAAYLANYGWYRLDARGNKPGVCAEFTPPLERLAFPIAFSGETDLPEIWSEPWPIVVSVLEGAQTYADVAENLPDIEWAH